MVDVFSARYPNGNCLGCGLVRGAGHSANCPAPPGDWVATEPTGRQYHRQDDYNYNAEVSRYGIETCLCGEDGSYNTYASVHLPFALVAEMMRSAGWTVEPPKEKGGEDV